jgi:hypothetical protein
MGLTKEGADQIRSLHYRAVKAAQAYESATPGTRAKALKEAAWQRAEKEFEKALEQ